MLLKGDKGYISLYVVCAITVMVIENGHVGYNRIVALLTNVKQA